MSNSSYDELLKQVECLKAENSHLRCELQDNSSHLTKLENEASNMKDVLSHIQLTMQDGECEYQDAAEMFGEGGLSINSTLIDLSTDDLDPTVDNESWAEGVDNVQCFKSAANSPSRHITDAEHEMYVLLNDLDLERNALMREIQTEDDLRECFFRQLEVLSQKLETLPLSENYNLQTDMMRRQVEYEAKKLEAAMTEKFGTSEDIAQRQEARLQRIRNIEAEMMMLQQRHREQQLQKQRQASMENGSVRKQTVATNTALCGEIFVPKPGVDNARTSDRVIFTGGSGRSMVCIGCQTSDVIIQENPDILQANISQNNNLSSIYHGSWPIGKGIPNVDMGGIPDLRGQDLASVMSFNSTNTSSTTGSSVANGDDSNAQQPQQQLGTKVEMVYSLLSMLGTHDKDDMSRTLLAMSSSQDSCIAMRQSGCMPLLIQLLHGSDKDSGLLGNTRGSKAARARASAALHNIVHSHPDDKRGRREARVLRLLEQIRAHCDQLRGDNSEEEEDNGSSKTGATRASDIDHHPGPAIAALMKLSFDEEHRHAICTLGGLQAIAELLEVDHEANGPTTEQYNITMRRYACMALTNLTFGDGTNKALLCSMKGAMEGLVAQLASPNEDLCQVAASVLRNLSWRADLASKKTLREVSAVTTLMTAAMQVKKESTLKSILSALWNLSAHCTENKADICAVPGALEFLVSTLTYKSPSKTQAIIENGGGILRNVSSHIAVREDYRKTLRHHMCLQLLLKHLRSTSLTIVSNACGTLWNLSARCQEDQQALWEMGAVSMLRNLVHSKHKMISMGSAAALKNLLSARPQMKNLDMDRSMGSNRPGLHARKVRALEQELDANLAETCENVESPRSSPTETKKDPVNHRRFSNDNVVVFPVPETEPRRPVVRGHVYPRSGSTDSSDGKLRSPQRVARSGSQDSVGSTHSDISHDRSRAHTMLAKSSRLLHERQASSLERKSGMQRFNSDGCSVDRRAGPNSRILQVMQEVAMHAGIPASESDNHPVPQNVRALAYQNAQMKAGTFPNPHFGKNNFPYAQNGNMQQKRNNMDMSGPTMDTDDQPINYSLKYQDAPSRAEQLNNRPAVKVGNYMGQPVMPRPMPNMVHNRFPAPGRQVFQPRHRNVGAHQGIPSQFGGAYAETDIDMDDQPTNYSLRYAENVEETYQDQPINYSVRYHDDESQYQQPVQYKANYQQPVQYKAEYQQPGPYKQVSNGYQESEEADSHNEYRASEEEEDPNCADCKLEEARRTNDRLDEYMPSFFLDDQVKTFCTEGTPYLSTATSLTDLTGKILYKEEDEDKKEDEASDEAKDFSNYEEETSGSGSRTTDLGTGSTVIPNTNLTHTSSAVVTTDEPERDVEHSFHSPTDKNAPLDQPKTYAEEGTPVCFSRVSSLSSLHSSDIHDMPDQQGRHQLALSSIEESDKNELSTSVIENHEARKIIKDGSTTPGTPGTDVVEKEHKTVTFDDTHHVEETPLMFSRCSSLGSLSSFDTQSVHSSVISEYSRRASEVVSPSELPDSPSETMPTSPKPEPEEKVEDDGKPKDFTQSIVSGSDVVTPVKNFSALIAADNMSVISKFEAPVVYAEEGTPPTMSDTQSLLSVLTIDDDASLKKKVEFTLDDSTSEGTKVSSQHNEENSSMSEVSEGEEDILAQCISSAMPVPNNSSRKMRKSSSDNALKKKSNLPKIDNLGSATKSKLPTKVSNITAEASKPPASKLPFKDPKSSPGKPPVVNMTPSKGAKTSPGKSNEATIHTVKSAPNMSGSPTRSPRPASKIAQSTSKSPSRIAQSVPRSPQTPRQVSAIKPMSPRGQQIQQPSSPKHVGTVRPMFTPTKAGNNHNVNNAQPASPRQLVQPGTPKQFVQPGTPRQSTQLGTPRQFAPSSIPQSTPHQTMPNTTPFTMSTQQYMPTTCMPDLSSYSPDYNSDQVTTYATEGTPLNFSNANSVSDLSSLSFDEHSVHFKDSPAPQLPPDDVKSDSSSLCEETEELLVSQVIQAAMPKSKVARRLDMDRQAEGAEDGLTGVNTQQKSPAKAMVAPMPQVIPQAHIATVQHHNQALSSTSVPVGFQPQRTSSLAVPPQQGSKIMDALGSKTEPGPPKLEAADTMKTYHVEGTPLNFSNATSLSDLTIDSYDDASRFNAPDESSKFSHSQSVSHGIVPGHGDDSVFFGDSVDSPQVYQVEGTPLTFSRSDSLSELSMLSGDVTGGIKPGSSDTVSTSSSSIPKERLPVIGQSSEESSVVLDQTNKEDDCKKYAMEDTPMCFSRNSSLSSLASPEPEKDLKELKDIKASPDQQRPYKVEDTPTVFSRNSSLSELSVESTAFDATEQALLDECINSAMPKSKVYRDDKLKRASMGRNRDKKNKKLTKSASLEMNGLDGHQSMDESVFKHPASTMMTYSCSDAQEMYQTSMWGSQSGSSRKSSGNSQFGWKRSQSQDSEYFLKDRKDSSNMEIAGHRPILRSEETLDDHEGYDNHMLEEARALRDKLLASYASSGFDSMNEKMDSEKSHLADSFIQKMALTQSQTTEPPCENGMDVSFPEDETTAFCDEADDTVLSNNGGDNTVLYNEPDNKQETSGSFEEEISAEDILLLEENASLIVSELSTNQMVTSNCDDDMFIEHETLSLVSNDYTSDTASEISVSWSNTSEKASEYSGSTISAAEGSVASQKSGPKIIKPGTGRKVEPVEKSDPGAVRGRRKPLYQKPTARTSPGTKTEPANRNARSSSGNRSQATRPPVQAAAGKRIPGKTPTPSATSTPNKAAAAANKRLSKSPGPNNRSGSASGIPRNTGVKTSPPSKGPSPKDNAKKTERPKPPIKQGTFTKDSSSVTAPNIDNSEAGKVNGDVKMREKKSTAAQGQRNSAGSSRNSGGSPPEAWSKALDGFNFIVDNNQENGPPYKQIQMQRNANGGPSALKKPTPTTGSSPNAKKPSNIARPIAGASTPPRSNSRNNLIKSGSGSNLRKTSSGTSLTKTTSGSSLNKTSSGTALNRGGSASNLRRQDGKQELKKSDSNASLKTNSRPTTPLGRRSSNSSISSRKSEGVASNKSSPPSGEKKTPSSDKKPPVGGKKQVPSKIATLWKKDDGDSPPNNSSRLPVSSAAKKRTPPKPSGIPTHPAKPTATKPSPPRRTDSLPVESTMEQTKEGITKSSTYDKITADLETGSIPNSDTDVDELETGGSDLNMAFQESPSVTLLETEPAEPEQMQTQSFVESCPTFSLGDQTCDFQSRTATDTMSSLSYSADSLDDLSMHSLPVNSGTWKKKRADILSGSLTLPNADETCRSVPSSLSTIINQSCDDSNIDMSNSSTVWRRYPDDTSTGPTGELQIWVKRESKKDKKKSSKKEGKSVAQSIKSTLFGKKPGLSKIFHKSSKDKKNKEEPKAPENSHNLLANPKAGSLWQESRTSPSAIVPPFNYSPPANTPKPETVTVPNNRIEVPVPDPILSEKKIAVPPPTSTKHATKTEMLLARRRQSYLNSSMKLDESGVEEENKRPCMVTTV